MGVADRDGMKTFHTSYTAVLSSNPLNLEQNVVRRTLGTPPRLIHPTAGPRHNHLALKVCRRSLA